MKYLTPLLILCFFSTQILGFSNLKNDSLDTKSQGLKGDIYLNVSFVKAGEDHDTYPLEQAIDMAKIYLEENFAVHGIHFYYLPSTEYIGSKDQLLNEWDNYTLPRFKDELTIYVYEEEDIKNVAHKYSFLGISPEIALVPYYNQDEFNQYVLKNILHLLGLDMKTLNEALRNVDDPVEHEIIETLSLKNRLFFEETFTPKKSNFLKKLVRNTSNKEVHFIDTDNALAIRVSIAENDYLLDKRLRFQPYESSSSPSQDAYNTVTDLN